MHPRLHPLLHEPGGARTLQDAVPRHRAHGGVAVQKRDLPGGVPEVRALHEEGGEAERGLPEQVHDGDEGDRLADAGRGHRGPRLGHLPEEEEGGGRRRHQEGLLVSYARL